MSDTSSDLEHEAEASRRRLARLLDELRFRVSPGEVVERLMLDANGHGAGSEFLRTLREQIRTNPVACMLIAAGITWMVLSDLRKNRRAGLARERRAPAPRRSRASAARAEPAARSRAASKRSRSTSPKLAEKARRYHAGGRGK